MIEFLDDLRKAPKVYAQSVYQSHSIDNISNSSENVKQKQLEIIEKVNPAPNTYNTWIRKVEDIKKLPYSERKKVFRNLMANDFLGRTAKFKRNGHTYYAKFDESSIV